MKIKFKELEYQQKAISSVCDLFSGATIKDFSIDNFEFGLLNVVPNKLDFSDELIRRNFKKITIENGISCVNGYNNSETSRNKFEVEMETGTGKTFVFLSTIFELNKRYGLSKFIIFVPSIAIREGIKKTIDQTKEYFQSKYNNKILDAFIWNSKTSVTNVRNFAQNNQDNLINVFIGTIQSFKSKGKNIIHQENETLGGENSKPIDFLSAVRPVIIVDEPQKTTSTESSMKVIDEFLNPLFTISYSATHKNINNLVYRLSAFDAYNQKLVKKIILSSSDENLSNNNESIVRLKEIVTKKNVLNAKVEFLCIKNNITKIKSEIVSLEDDLFNLSGKNLFYQGYIVESINADEKSITFANGVKIFQDNDEIDDEFKKILMRRLIETHLQKEVKNLKYGVKTLSLFFIDKVDRYRKYDEENNVIEGDYSKWFNEIYQSVILDKNNEWFVQKLPEEYKDLKNININNFHGGYFSIDKKSGGKEEKETSTYDLILKDKEKLLSLDNKMRFIFSHSALREGWDNPNVFNICILKDGVRNEISRRQEIGRGLRLCVDQNGERLPKNDYDLNKLTVISSETYESFIENLQKEINEDIGVGKIISIDYNDKINFELKKNVLSYLTHDGYVNQGKATKVLIDIYKKGGVIDFKNKLSLSSEENDLMNNWIKEQLEFNESKLIKNQRNLVSPRVNKEKFKEFEPILKSLKTPHYFTLDDNKLDINYLSGQILNEINKQFKIFESKKVTFTDFDIDKYGSSSMEKGSMSNIQEYSYEYECDLSKLSSRQKEAYRLYYINDILKFIGKKTNLKLSTIDQIIKESNTLNYLFINREKYRNLITNIFEEQMFRYFNDEEIYSSIKYEFLDEYNFDSEKIVNSMTDDIEITKENEQHIFEDKENKNKSLFSAFQLHSTNEVAVANFLNGRNDISLFTKLPNLEIKMPFSKYNPDWFIKRCDDKIVLESKVSISYKNVKQSETFKIDLFAKFIDQMNEKINTNIIFETISKSPMNDNYIFTKKSK